MTEANVIPGANAYAACLACKVEYAQETTQCERCKLALLQFRRCPECKQAMSARHVRCRYCSISFLKAEAAAPDAEALPQKSSSSRLKAARSAKRRLATALALVVFSAIFFGGVLLRMRNESAPAPALGTSYVVRASSLRQTTSPHAAVLSNLPASSVVELLGYTAGPGGRWFYVRWQKIPGFMLTEDLAPPRPERSAAGLDLLRFWLAGVKSEDYLPEALKAIDSACVPTSDVAQCDELRWMLAERAAALAPRSPKAGTVLNLARSQYEVLVSTGGAFAADAAQALSRLPKPRMQSRTSVAARSPGIRVSGATAPELLSSSEQRRFSLVDQTQIRVRLPVQTAPSAGTILTGAVASDVRVNNEVVIPAGSLCELQIGEAIAAEGPGYTVRLTSIVVREKKRPVKSSIAKVRPLAAGTDDAVIVFSLESPLLLPR